jgi:ribonuclease BN (tRNA processing enzyme)
MPVYERRNRLRILGYEGARLGLDTVLRGQMEGPFFPVRLHQVPANISIEELKDYEFSLGPVRVSALPANHPGTCVGYRLFTASGSIAFFPDNEPYPARPLPGLPAPEQLAAKRTEMIEFLKGADVLIMDTQYDSEEYREHVGWGHGCLDDVVALALEAKVKRLFLFHHDPDHDDAKITAMLGQARKLAQGTSLAVDAAREGLTVSLPGQEAA